MATASTEDSNDTTGTKPKVEKNLTSQTRAISSVSQALSICDQMMDDAEKIIKNAARVTKKLNGGRPRNDRSDANKAKAHKSNVSTGALSNTCSKIPPRFYMPIKSARYLVAGSLASDVDGAASKTEYFREIITAAIRRWRKWPFFIEGLSTEASLYGYVFPTFFDEYDWRPKLIRQDKGFVPVGTEILDTDLPFFCVSFPYRPDELLALARGSSGKKGGPWFRDNVAKAVENALPPEKRTDDSNARTFEDLVRQASTGASYAKGSKTIETYHLFAKELSGKVSHYILLDNRSGKSLAREDEDEDTRLLYKKLDQFETMEEVTLSMVFQFGNGTIHGSLGAGHILYDMSVQVELARNESFDNLKQANKIKLQVPDGKDINAVKATVLDEKIIVSGAQFAGANASIPVTVDDAVALDQQMTRLMDEKVGAFLPPAPIPGTSPTATQVNVQTAREEEIRNSMLDRWLTQFALLTYMMAKRLCNTKSQHKEAKDVLAKLKKRLSSEEIEQLVESCALQNVLEFTEIITQRRAQFAQSVRGNPYYDQSQVERMICEAAVGTELARQLMPPKQDQAVLAEAARQQMFENSAIKDQMDVPVTPTDNDYVHMETMKQPLVLMIQQGNVEVAQLGLKHYQAHYDQWVAKKAEPKDQRNPEKKFIRSLEVAIESAQKKRAAQQQALTVMNGGATPPGAAPQAQAPMQPLAPTGSTG